MSSFLQKYKRQPKLFIDLPSQGKWYNDTIIQDGKVESMPVFGMTAMDEILLKTCPHSSWPHFVSKLGSFHLSVRSPIAFLKLV